MISSLKRTTHLLVSDKRLVDFLWRKKLEELGCFLTLCCVILKPVFQFLVSRQGETLLWVSLHTPNYDHIISITCYSTDEILFLLIHSLSQHIFIVFYNYFHVFNIYSSLSSALSTHMNCPVYFSHKSYSEWGRSFSLHFKHEAKRK